MEPRIIYVSQGANSTDLKNCGSTTRPCNHLQRAIQISKESDIILLNVEYIYVQSEYVKIPHSLTISSYQEQGDGKYSRKATLVYKEDVNYSLFVVAANLKVSNVSMKILGLQHFQLQLFKLITEGNISKGKQVGHSNIEISNVLFNGASSAHSQKAHNMKRHLDKNALLNNRHLNLKLHSCTFITTTLSITGTNQGEIHITGNLIKTSRLELSFSSKTLSSFINNQFRQSLVTHYFSNSEKEFTIESPHYIDECTFDNTEVQVTFFKSGKLYVSNTHFKQSSIRVNNMINLYNKIIMSMKKTGITNIHNEPQ